MINLITSILMISAIGLSVPKNKVHYDYFDNGNYEYIEVEKPNEKLVSYDDEDNKITLTAYELNNYVFNNLNTYLYNNGVTSVDFSITGYIVDDANWENNIYFIGLYSVEDENDYIFFNYANEDDNKFAKGYYNELTESYDLSTFSNSIELDIGETVYSGIKQAIEADIAANTSSYSFYNFLVDGISLLVGGITGVSSGIGQGLSTLVSDLAVQSNTMSPFMAVIFLFGGISLALALCRWVVNLLGSLGRRNR